VPTLNGRGQNVEKTAADGESAAVVWVWIESVTRGRAKEAVIVSVEFQLIGFSELPGSAAAGDDIGMVSGPPGVGRGNVAGNAATVISDQDIKFSGNERSKERPAFVPGGAAFEVLDGQSFCVSNAADLDFAHRPGFRMVLPIPGRSGAGTWRRAGNGHRAEADIMGAVAWISEGKTGTRAGETWIARICTPAISGRNSRAQV
jgi:hypothetical protein